MQNKKKKKKKLILYRVSTYRARTETVRLLHTSSSERGFLGGLAGYLSGCLASGRFTSSLWGKQIVISFEAKTVLKRASNTNLLSSGHCCSSFLFEVTIFN